MTLLFGLVLMGVGLGNSGDNNNDKKRKVSIKDKLTNMAVRTLYLSFGLFVASFGLSLVLSDVIGKEAIEAFLDGLDKAVAESENK
jgi:hypothetical protein